MGFNRIIEKYNYDEEIANFLKQVYDEFIKYFGGEEIIYEAFLNTPIVNHNSCYDYLKENNYLDEFQTLVSDDDLKRASGVYHSSPTIIYDSVDNSYKIVEIKRCVVVVDFDLSKEYKKATLIHELCHLVKSYLNEFQILGDTLVEQSGLITRTYKLAFENNTVTKKLVSEVGVGLEEGITSINEEDICKNVVNPDYKISGYITINALARNLWNNEYLRNLLLNAEMYKNKEELCNVMGITNYEKLVEVMDRIYYLYLNMFANMFNAEKMQKISEEIGNIIQNEYKNILSKLDNNLNL